MSLRPACSDHPGEKGGKPSRNSQLERRLRRRSVVQSRCALRGFPCGEVGLGESSYTPGAEKVALSVLGLHDRNMFLGSVPSTITTLKAG